MCVCIYIYIYALSPSLFPSLTDPLTLTSPSPCIAGTANLMSVQKVVTPTAADTGGAGESESVEHYVMVLRKEV